MASVFLSVSYVDWALRGINTVTAEKIALFGEFLVTPIKQVDK